MPLNNSQYDTIIRDYQRRQSIHRRQKEERVRNAYEKLPRLREIDDEVASLSVACGKKLLSGDSDALTLLKKQIQALGTERARLLTLNGYPADYLQLTYDCPDCKDSGYIGSQKCHCFKKAEIELLYTQSNIREILEQENFNTFSFEYYSADVRDPKNGVSSLERIQKVVDTCHQFIDNFDTVPANLFFYGDTGVGKTFLSHCIARELIETTHSVIYFSAQKLFELFAKERFEKNAEQRSYSEYIYDCDLLIIDDLGTELTNSFVNSELFLCINERLINRRSTIISTNLPLDVFSETYSERIFSRISTDYIMLKLFGNDIRLQKKISKVSGKKPCAKPVQPL